MNTKLVRLPFCLLSTLAAGALADTVWLDEMDLSKMKPGDAAKSVDVVVKGTRLLLLQVTDGGNGVEFDHGNWAQAQFVFAGAKPRAISSPVPKEEAVILTPKPGPAPRINGPKVYGAHPGNPFIYRVPTQGERPMTFSVENLPVSLKLDAANGIITGTTPTRGEYQVTLHAKNAHGESARAFKLVSGDTLSLTPQMGWNHWYTHYDRITDRLMREAADVMVSSGMADYIHSKGLRAGIYTSPGPLTCAGFAAACQHEAADAKQFADWGFDFLKYDWCSYGGVAKKDTDPELVKFKKPYKLMGELLKQQKRDIVLVRLSNPR